ncbi:thiosulfate sulfurtransferase [Bombina bombina]|uniref:thiosulfate sulfurtransferase n=1 Tax=Bombina bombina TaxID=8345 RepID=UPI00235AA065|nr:thiosulfate sulfurtransferase [Bombina bombina]
MAQQASFRAFVSAGWLAGALRTRPSLRVLDATWYSPGGKNAQKEFEERHIPGASFFDLEQCKDQKSPYEMMLPSQSTFAKFVGNLGINNSSQVVVYDSANLGMLYAPRLWWMFRLFGHNNVSVLDGGLKNWIQQGFPVTSETTKVKPENFQTVLNPKLLKSFEEIQENISSKKFQVADARSESRFKGPEPKPGEDIEPGHIRGSVNLPFSSFLSKEGYEKSPDELKRLFQEKGIDLTKPLTATCRRGVTACHIALASFVLGQEDTAVYDGSWSEFVHRGKPEHKVYERKSGKA